MRPQVKPQDADPFDLDYSNWMLVGSNKMETLNCWACDAPLVPPAEDNSHASLKAELVRARVAGVVIDNRRVFHAHCVPK